MKNAMLRTSLAVWLTVVTRCSPYAPGPMSTWIGGRLRTDKPARYVTTTKVNSAFYPVRDGKMNISFWAYQLRLNLGIAITRSDDNPRFVVDKTLLVLIPGITRVSRVILS